jgi:biopolymer transport protein ExbB
VPAAPLAYNRSMLFAPLLAAVDATNTAVAAGAKPLAVPPPGFGVMFWVLVFVSATAIAVVIERVLYFHRVQIDSAQFLAGVRNVLKRDNIIEALSICDATPGPVARLVKAAILNRDGGRARVEEVIEEVGQTEVPRLEHNLPLLATIAQVAPLLGLLGTLLGFAGVFRELRRPDGVAFGYAAPGQMFDGMMQALYAAALGIAIAAFCYAAYNYLVHCVNLIVLDMERASREAVRLAIGDSGGNGDTARTP